MKLEIIYDHEHPHWIDNADSWICSNCGYETGYQKKKCPHCGADMAENERDSKR